VITRWGGLNHVLLGFWGFPCRGQWQAQLSSAQRILNTSIEYEDASLGTIHQLYWLRFLLGLAEAGYFPGIVLYLTYWFRQGERARALALFMTALPVTSIFGAPVSGLLLDNAHWLGVSGRFIMR